MLANFNLFFTTVVVNMFVAKYTPAEIVKALIEEISYEEGEPHCKKLRRAVHKKKDDEKKKNSSLLLLVICYLRTKMTEIVICVPCACYHPLFHQYI